MMSRRLFGSFMLGSLTMLPLSRVVALNIDADTPAPLDHSDDCLVIADGWVCLKSEFNGQELRSVSSLRMVPAGL